MTALAACNAPIDCPDGTVCHMELVITNGQKYYNLGCKDIASCITGPAPTHPVPVGRSAPSRRDLAPCSDCCSVPFCNRQLCQPPEASCTNQASYDCSTVGSTFNLCADTVHAKLKCRRFCGLCSLQDGGWSAWNTWSACSATCAGGTQTRSRLCTDPVPQDGGLECSGKNSEQQDCAAGPCPVQGVWEAWQGYGACSSTCDIGMQTRLRTCVFPATVETSRGERPCDGETSQSRLCFSAACADGGWGSWGTWGACSRSCGDGLRSRSRACDSPPRSVLGRDCPGDSSHAELCTIVPCPGLNVVFLARTVGTIPSLNTVIFKTVEQNVGNGYNNVTGKFTAPVSGTYSFSAQLCPKTSAVVFQLMKDNDVIGGFYHGTGSGGCASLVSDVMLNAGEAVWVRSYYTGGDVFEDENSIWNMFTGVLIRKSS